MKRLKSQFTLYIVYHIFIFTVLEPDDKSVNYAESKPRTLEIQVKLWACLQGERVALESGLSTNAFSLFFSLRRVYKAARVTRTDGLPYLRVRVTLVGGINFFACTLQVGLTRLPGLTLQLVPDPRALLKLSRVVGLPHLWNVLVNPGYLLPST